MGLKPALRYANDPSAKADGNEKKASMDFDYHLVLLCILNHL